MPAPSRTSLDRIVAAGRATLTADGVDGLTMQRVAAEAGVRAPSLYKHVDGRAALIRLVVADVAVELREALDVAGSTGDAAGDLRAMAAALRAFALRDPHAFAAMFSPAPEGALLADEDYAATAAPILEACGRLTGPDRALDAARTVTAWASGFLSMELGGVFHLGGDVERAYDFGVEVMVDALSRTK